MSVFTPSWQFRRSQPKSAAVAVPGAAVFLNRGKQTAPLAVRANVEHLRVLHEHVVILSIETMPQPRVPVADRLVIDELGYSGDGIMHVTARFGTWTHRTSQWSCDSWLPRPTLSSRSSSTPRRTFCPPLNCAAAIGRRWRPGASACSSPRPRAADAAEYFGLPRDRTMIMAPTSRCRHPILADPPNCPETPTSNGHRPVRKSSGNASNVGDWPDAGSARSPLSARSVIGDGFSGEVCLARWPYAAPGGSRRRRR